jgi:hypothetical protein
MKKKAFLFLSTLILLFGTGASFGQQVYDDFDGKNFQFFGPVNGVIDTRAKNPKPNAVDKSNECAKYTRPKGVPYASIKMNTKHKLLDVEKYATHLGTPPKIKVKVYTKSAIGTKVEVQLGRKGETYPTGVHSVYQGATTKQNEWEEITLNFAEVPKESQLAATEVDQIILMFAPNSSNTEAFYFDDIEGPSLSTIPALEEKPVKK